MGLEAALKVCKSCGLSKPLEAFHHNKRRSDGLQPYCRACKRTYDREYHETNREKKKQYYEANRDKKLAYRKQYYEANRDKEKQYYEANQLRTLLRAARSSNKARIARGRTGLVFDLTLDDLQEIYEEQSHLCWWFGVELTIDKSPDNPLLKVSLDRLDPNLGYFKANVVLCCMAANLFRRDASFEQTLELLDLLSQGFTSPALETEESIG